MNKKLFLFDVDGTLCLSGQQIINNLANKINILKSKNYEIGIVGGGKYEVILHQMNNKIIFDYIFSESGSVYHKLENSNYNFIYKNNLREHKLYYKINILIKCALNYLSMVDYLVTGNFIDLRNGLVYISLIGMSANIQERYDFLELDKDKLYRTKLLDILQKKAIELGISDELDITFGGSVGISINPKEWNKIQVLNTIKICDYDEIYYFGDKYDKNGNDYELINYDNIKGIRVDSPIDTEIFLDNFLN